MGRVWHLREDPVVCVGKALLSLRRDRLESLVEIHPYCGGIFTFALLPCEQADTSLCIRR